MMTWQVPLKTTPSVIASDWQSFHFCRNWLLAKSYKLIAKADIFIPNFQNMTCRSFAKRSSQYREARFSPEVKRKGQLNATLEKKKQFELENFAICHGCWRCFHNDAQVE